jgi:drug/metabolite transporter (DMT)-like permease
LNQDSSDPGAGPNPRRTALAIAAAILAVVIWGAWFPIARLSVTTSITPWDLALLRFSFAAIVLLPVVARHGMAAGRTGWLGALVMALSVGAPFALLLGIGIRSAPAAHAAVFIPGVFPTLTFILGLVFLGDPVTWRRTVGVILVAAGVALVGWAALEGSGGGPLSSYGLFHICAWMWAIYTVTTRIAKISSMHATAILNVLTMALFLPFFLLFGESTLATLPVAELAFQIGYHGVLGGLVSILCYNHAINVLGASRAAIFGGLVPCVAALLSVPILGEALSGREIAGLVAVTVGVALVTGAIAKRPAPLAR